MLSLILAATVLAAAEAGFKPCTPADKSCCNPHVQPPQLCPGGLACQQCGGGDSCACPSGPSPPGPSPGPGPSPPPGPVSDTRLTIINGCSSSPLWIAHIAMGAVGPDPQDLKIAPSGSHRFHTAVNGQAVKATRFWPKMGCDATGNNCSIGDSGGPGEGCVIRAPGKPDDYSQCAPPFDSKFEATFGDGAAMDVVDMSLVDGYTLPFKLQATGGRCTRQTQPFSEMDCSGLSQRQCPTAEQLNGKAVDLRAINPKTGKHAGCYSPCTRLIDNKWNSGAVAADSPQAAPVCCAGADATPGACNAGPILKTAYLAEVKATCPAAYGYAYDDKIATIACTTSTEYTVTFYCPTASTADELEVLI